MRTRALLENRLYTFVKEKFYITTTNIDVSDGLANVAHGKLVHVEFNEGNNVFIVWLEFNDSSKISCSMDWHNYHEMPLILARDFDVNFADKKSEPLVKSLFDEFNLTMNSNPAVSPTKLRTTIDAVFSRCINNIEL
ncbi:hypothetical protein AVEN_65678-1 [Araneus ventricosus]|uniref:Uncharacterized protein n=1 Tax=Araneus ventricosus TaxID=182803 RepID=A0A4Y2VN08_ARAVE|nr:hypothetical protein AVEN_65678-1 [Araneus ventricosus]